MRCAGGCFGLAQAHQSSVWHDESKKLYGGLGHKPECYSIEHTNRALCTSSVLARAEILIRYHGRTRVYAMGCRARLVENGITSYPGMPSDLHLIISPASLSRERRVAAQGLQMQVQYYCWLLTKDVLAVLSQLSTEHIRC